MSQKLDSAQRLKLILASTSAAFVVILLVIIIIFIYLRRRGDNYDGYDVETCEEELGDNEVKAENLVTFQGGQHLTISDILEAPGEVIGKSNYGTLYKAFFQKSNCLRLLRFLRPVCTSRDEDLIDVIQLLGCVRHPCMVPLLGFYAGSRGEKLLVYPFFRLGNLAQFIRDGSAESHKWTLIYSIATGIAKGLDHLHTGLQKPIIHGNLKSKNILLDCNYQPCISDYGLHLLLNQTAAQEMLEASSAGGYKAPELIKMKDASEETDIYSFGVILLELLSGKVQVSEIPTPDEDFHLPSFMRNAVLKGRISDLYHPDILLGNGSDIEPPVSEECILNFLQLAMACCSPMPSFRPTIRQILWKLEDIGR